MDPSSSQHFHHHHQAQRHQRLPPSQSAGGAPSDSHSQPPSSPSASTAASSNPFVRSYHGDEQQVAPTPPTQSSASQPLYQRQMSEQGLAGTSTEAETQQYHRRATSSTHLSRSTSLSRTASSSSLLRSDEISVAIKCLSLDKDSAVVKVRPIDTVLTLKHIIERTWPGAPRAEGMRCIRNGRILFDHEIFGHISESVSLLLRPKSGCSLCMVD